MPNYWIGVVSKEHVELAQAGNFCQVCHGKKAPLARMKKGDYLLYYSPNLQMRDQLPYQQFTAFGQIRDEPIYSFAMSQTFVPYRRDIDYHPILRECPIDYARQHPEWKEYASQLRFGLFPVSRVFFNYIARYMIKED